MKARILSLGGEIKKGDPKAAPAFVQGSFAVWPKLLKENGISAE